MKILFLLLTMIQFSFAAGPIALDPELTNFTYPYPVEFFPQEIQKLKLRMAYMDIKPAVSNDKIVVLLHGKNFSGNYWQPTIAALVQSGFRVIVPDQIGFGKSSKPEMLQFSLELLGKATFDLMESLKIKNFILVGHSMGGMLASRMSLMHPEHITKLVLVNPIGLEDLRAIIPYQGVDQNFKDEMSKTVDDFRNYQKNVYFDGAWKPEYEKLIEIPAGQLKHPDYKRVAWNAALTTDLILTSTVIHEYKLIKVPTLLIIGTRDRTAPGKQLVPENIRKGLGDYSKLGKNAAKLISKSKLVEIQGVGHVPQVEAFEVYLKALQNFIK
jgi:pimeloyl-ACP methyl ester carboxylesterase